MKEGLIQGASEQASPANGSPGRRSLTGEEICGLLALPLIAAAGVSCEFHVYGVALTFALMAQIQIAGMICQTIRECRGDR